MKFYIIEIVVFILLFCLLVDALKVLNVMNDCTIADLNCLFEPSKRGFPAENSDIHLKWLVQKINKDTVC